MKKFKISPKVSMIVVIVAAVLLLAAFIFKSVKGKEDKAATSSVAPYSISITATETA